MEGQWPKAALTAAEAHIDFARYLPAGSAKAPHKHAYEYFYDQLRTSIFHAKGSRGPQLPHDVTGMADLASRHERLTRLYLDLLGEMTGVGRPSSVITYAGSDMFTGGWENNPVVHITDDAPFYGELRLAGVDRFEIAGSAPGSPRAWSWSAWSRTASRSPIPTTRACSTSSASTPPRPE